jgi:hypothetical protein
MGAVAHPLAGGAPRSVVLEGRNMSERLRSVWAGIFVAVGLAGLFGLRAEAAPQWGRRANERWANCPLSRGQQRGEIECEVAFAQLRIEWTASFTANLPLDECIELMDWRPTDSRGESLNRALRQENAVRRGSQRVVLGMLPVAATVLASPSGDRLLVAGYDEHNVTSLDLWRVEWPASMPTSTSVYEPAEIVEPTFVFERRVTVLGDIGDWDVRAMAPLSRVDAPVRSALLLLASRSQLWSVDFESGRLVQVADGDTHAGQLGHVPPLGEVSYAFLGWGELVEVPPEASPEPPADGSLDPRSRVTGFKYTFTLSPRTGCVISKCTPDALHLIDADGDGRLRALTSPNLG